MRTRTKAMALALCAVLLVASTVFVTMAFLTDSESVQNTFTVGKVGITLDEAKVKPDGIIEAGADRASTAGRVKENAYHLIPGHKYVKDPTIHVDSDSETCWLFVKLENGLQAIIASKTIEEQMQEKGWTVIDATKNIWAYAATADAGANVPVFDEFTLKGEANVASYATTKDADGNVTAGPVIKVTAYAVQADGFATAIEAWTATFGK